jgi:DNA-binding winged helix-turn-helix (wHTH) protein
MTTSESTVAFANFRLDASNVSLWRGKQALKLKPKAFDVLHYLVDHAGQVVTKDALWRAIWPNVTVSDAVLTMCVRELRQALEDDAKAPRFIETVHRRGYRFIGQVVSS